MTYKTEEILGMISLLAWKNYEITEIERKLSRACTFKDYNNVLKDIEIASEVSKLCEMPNCSLSFPSHLPKEKWKNELIRQYDIDNVILKKLIDSDFYLVDKEIFNLSNERYSLLDGQYGVLLDAKNDVIRKIPLYTDFIIKAMERYKLSEPSLCLSMGNCIAQMLKFGKFQDASYIITYYINSRDELEDILSEWKASIKDYPDFSIWYRGQIQEYIFPDMGDLVSKICPWRNVRDISLTPSIFRMGDFKRYTYKMFEILKYQLEFAEYFHSCLVGYNYKDDIVKEKLPERFLKLPMSTEYHTESGEFMYRKDYHMEYVAFVQWLFQQHYGLESPLLDLTSDIDIALFFAQNRLTNNLYEKADVKLNNSVIYAFLINNDIDPFIDSELLMRDIKALRPLRQKCGILTGATNINKGFYSRFIAFKFVLTNNISYNSTYTQDYLFPSEEEDTFLSKLKQVEKEIGAKYVHPFEIKER